MLVVCGLGAALPIAGSAAEIHLCSTCDPPPIPITPTDNTLSEVQADNSSGDLTLTFINLTGIIMDDLVFGTTIDTQLSTQMLQDDHDFTCDVDTGLFMNCAVTYDPTSGALNYYYYGVNPPSILDTPGFVILEDIIGQGFGDTGIPNLGVFTVEMTGWTQDLKDGETQLYGSPSDPYPATFSNAYNAPVNVPEASSVLILLTELLLLAGVVAVFRRKLNLKQRFQL